MLICIIVSVSLAHSCVSICLACRCISLACSCASISIAHSYIHVSLAHSCISVSLASSCVSLAHSCFQLYCWVSISLGHGCVSFSLAHSCVTISPAHSCVSAITTAAGCVCVFIALQYFVLACSVTCCDCGGCRSEVPHPTPVMWIYVYRLSYVANTYVPCTTEICSGPHTSVWMCECGPFTWINE